MEPYSAIRSGSFEDFKTSLDENPDFDWKHFFLRAFRNQDLTGRVEIVNWMLDHGADPAHVIRSVSMILWGRRGCCSVFWMGVRILI